MHVSHTRLAAGGPSALIAYEDAATAVGRLDAAGAAAPAGFAELLVLRCAVGPFAAGAGGVIELLCPPADRGSLSAYLDALRDGARRARGGAVPSVATLQQLLAINGDASPVPPALDALLRDADGKTPPVLKATLVAGELLRWRATADAAARAAVPDADAKDHRTRPIASLALTLLLCVGGATTDAWLTLAFDGTSLATGPSAADDSWGSWLPAALTAVAREARAAERALTTARERIAADDAKIRDAFGRAAYSALDLHALMSAELAVTLPDAARSLGFTAPTAGAAMARLVALGVAREVTGRARSRVFIHDGLIAAMAP